VDVTATTVAAVVAEPTAADEAVATNKELAGEPQALVPFAARAVLQLADAAAVVGTDKAGTAACTLADKPRDAHLAVESSDLQAAQGTLPVP